MLVLKSFRKAFGELLILDLPDLTFKPGIHWVKGKNGSGKSTLFNCLAGLSPYEGEITLDGNSLKKSPEAYKLKLNYSQSEPIFPEFLSGNDLIHYFAKLKRANLEQIELLTKTLGVDTYADQPCGTYSSGMMKKVSIVLAFLGKPDWIILDEPLITLDKDAQALVTELIAKRHGQGTSFIFATHQDFENTKIAAHYTYEVKDRNITQL